ncbi:unnamed protein product [Linum tenue]|uniref:Uncharacterized protein n=2 Tax=Linum tenue TaxID=586396 RepID=A0AAV0J1F9_9ROSI|nr:unnamed protein product [Linum tenue]
MQSMKETASNIGASAKAGMEKTKATVQEKIEKASAHDPVQKEMAREKKEQRVAEAEAMKHSTKAHNAAAKQGEQLTGGHGNYSTGGTGGTGYGTIGDYGTTGAYSHSATGQPGYPTGTHQMSAMPGHGTGQPIGGHVDEGVARSHPSGLPGEQTGHNTRVGGTGTGHLPGYGTGGSLS